MSDTFDLTSAIMTYESGEMSVDSTIELFQKLIDNGMAWQLQGHYARTAEYLIKQGFCTPAQSTKSSHTSAS